MASLIDFTNLDLNIEEARSSADLIFQKKYVSPELEAIHEVMVGVEMDKYIPIMGRYGLSGKADPGGCASNEQTNQIPVSQKTWTPKLISARLIHCQDDIPSLLKFWKKARIAAKTWEEVDGEMMTFVEDRTGDSMHEGIIRHSEFGDTDASPVGDATGDQKLTVGTDKAYFNVMNGMWQQVFTDQALGTPLSYRFTITENAGASKAAQLTLADGKSLDAMRAMYNNIAPEAFEGSNLVLQMTRSLFSNWQDFLEDKSLAFTLTQAELKSGTDGWTYRGIPIKVRADWDRIIRTYYDNGTTYDLPHRIILADLNIIPIGTSDTESLTALSSFFDKVTKKHYIDYAYKVDMKILLEEEIAVAY